MAVSAENGTTPAAVYFLGFETSTYGDGDGGTMVHASSASK